MVGPNLAALARRGGSAGLGHIEKQIQRAGIFEDRRNVILTYHSVGDPIRYGNISGERFERDLRYLDNYFEVVDVPEVLQSPTTGPKKVAITFDDAYRNFYHHALPVIRSYDVPVTVFVPTGFIEDENEAFAYRFFQSPTETENYNNPAHQRAKASPRPDIMTMDQLRELAEDEQITLGNHSRTHPDLSEITDEVTLEVEIVAAKESLEELFGIPIDRFSFPYGRYSVSALRTVRGSHDLAVTSRPASLSGGDDTYRLPRIGADIPEVQLRWLLTDARWTLANRHG